MHCVALRCMDTTTTTCFLGKIMERAHITTPLAKLATLSPLLFLSSGKFWYIICPSSVPDKIRSITRRIYIHYCTIFHVLKPLHNQWHRDEKKETEGALHHAPMHVQAPYPCSIPSKEKPQRKKVRRQGQPMNVTNDVLLKYVSHGSIYQVKQPQYSKLSTRKHKRWSDL